ncbi:MAG: YscQ/HrcQ family type III secretion apparatus protein [Deltaproteobacteria bacterium]|nr:YscQ/HrcQ family type III secretion apparatus protein [Deltaproteobacteria bacterium]
MARQLRRYRFSALKKLTKRQVHLTNTLLEYLPLTIFETGFKERIRELMEPLVKADVDFWLDRLIEITADDMPRVLTSPTTIAVIAIPPREEKILIEVDLTIVQRAIDRMLGGDGEDIDPQRRLSEIENGVYCFLLVKFLSMLQEEQAGEFGMTLKLEGVFHSVTEAKLLFPANEEWTALGYKIFFDVAVGYCRVLFPAGLIDGAFTPPEPQSGSALNRLLGSLAQRAPRVAAIRQDLVIEAGRIKLVPEDLGSLDEGDIILVENPDMQIQDEVVSGTVQCHVGSGKSGLVTGELVVGDNGNYEVVIQELLALEEPETAGGISDDVSEEPSGQEYAEEHSMPKLPLERKTAAHLAHRVRTSLAQGAAKASLGEYSSPSNVFDDEERLFGEHSDDYEGGYEDGGDGDLPLPEAANMLSDIAVDVVLELGRVNVSAADVMGLRPGQVIELTKSPSDPVDLVVDGKRIGQGELVEIEGELGVRILRLTGE